MADGHLEQWAKFEQALAKVGGAPPEAHDALTTEPGGNLQYRLLTDACEDHTDLTEAVLETMDEEAMPVAGRYARAESALRQLLDRGWIRLYRTHDGRTYEAVEADEVDSVLSHPNSWFPMYPGHWTAFGATEEGERVWKNGLFPGR